LIIWFYKNLKIRGGNINKKITIRDIARALNINPPPIVSKASNDQHS